MKPKTKKVKKIKAFAVLVSVKQIDSGNTLAPFGNGKQFQYPIFNKKFEALDWAKEDRNTRGKIIPVTITYHV